MGGVQPLISLKVSIYDAKLACPYPQVAINMAVKNKIRYLFAAIIRNRIANVITGKDMYQTGYTLIKMHLDKNMLL